MYYGNSRLPCYFSVGIRPPSARFRILVRRVSFFFHPVLPRLRMNRRIVDDANIIIHRQITLSLVSHAQKQRTPRHIRTFTPTANLLQYIRHVLYDKYSII